MNTCATCQGGTRRYYGTHCPECAHPYPVTARPATNNEHAEQTRHSIDPQDTDGGTAATAIEEEAESLDEIGGRPKAFARSLGARPGWTDLPAVQAWHRRDRTPSNPRIWSPDYGTTERWSTPSLRGVHWSALVGVTPLYPIETESRACPDPDAHWRLDDARMTIKEQQDLIDALRADLARAEAINREITNEMVERGWTSISPTLREALSRHTIRRILETALTEPQRPHGAQELTPVVEEMLETYWRGDLNGEDVPDFLAERGVRLTEKEQS